MRRPIPKIKESSQLLEEMMHKKSDLRVRIRIKMLLFFKSGEAETRLEVAEQLGVHRNTVGRWLKSYESGGIEELVSIGTNSGDRGQRSIPEEVFELLKERLKSDGFNSYKEIQLWLEEEHGLEIPYVTLHQIVRYRLGSKLKVARRSHIKKA